MQVKKFEAKTMKEALELVKTQMGPEAIILNAREISKGLGLIGLGSVEITAAISEETLRKKQMAEMRIPKPRLEQFSKSTARVQKQVINDFVDSHLRNREAKSVKPPKRYIDIPDDFEQDNKFTPESRPTVAETASASGVAGARIKDAAQKAWLAMVDGSPEVSRDVKRDRTETPKSPSPLLASNASMEAVMAELTSLKKTLAQFQSIPQNMMNNYPGSDYGLPYEFSLTFEKLCTAGVDKEIVAEILTTAHKQMPPIKYKNRALIEGWVANYFLNNTKIENESAVKGVQVFLGPPGSGKTSTLIKVASRHVLSTKKKAAILTLDTKKVGAVDQLRVFAQILNLPFGVIKSVSDWDYALREFGDSTQIFVDTPGVHPMQANDLGNLKALLPGIGVPSSHHLVLSATSKDSDLTAFTKQMMAIKIQNLIFTGLDLSTHHGSIYNMMRNFQLPLYAFSIGPKVPEDFEFATRERVLDLVFKLTKMKRDAA
jgi:flagellar biosynthesis protein FlhF